jgi:hypothetical protein
MDISYHEAIGTTYRLKIPFKVLDGLEGPIFWITSSSGDMFVRCGVSEDFQHFVEKFTRQDSEQKLIIIRSYHNGQLGYHDMKMFKQNFKRVHAGKPYRRY